MKTLPVSQYVLKHSAEDATGHTTISMLRYCLDFPPQGGFTPSILRERARIDDVLAKTEPGTEIQLEDADFAVARKCVEDARWNIRHPDITGFLNLWGL